MFSAVRAQTFPARLTFCVYVVMTEGRGQGNAQIRVVEEDTDVVIYPGTAHELRFSSNPLDIVAVSFDIASCSFPKPGLYRVEFVYNGNRLAHQPLLLRDDQ
ncbi:MAG: hypothetical protein L0Y71_19635 [Gemmataceae bacterium]|nr:hypothetical protein [Gemmataceae bacterium]